MVAYFVSPPIFVSISEIEFIMRILGDSCELMMILSFLLGFTLALIAISFVTYRISYLIETSIFNEINKIFGLFFGLIDHNRKIDCDFFYFYVNSVVLNLREA